MKGKKAPIANLHIRREDAACEQTKSVLGECCQRHLSGGAVLGSVGHYVALGSNALWDAGVGAVWDNWASLS